MAYIGSSGSPLPVAFSSVRTQSFNGNGSNTTFTMSRSVSAVTDIEVVVNNVQQSPFDGSYNITGASLVFSEAPSSGTNNVYVIFRDQPVASIIDTTAVRKAGDTMTGALIAPGISSTNGMTVNGGRLSVGQTVGDVMQIGKDTAGNAFIDATQANADFGIYINSSTTGYNKKLGVDSAGRVSIPYQPAFRAGAVGGAQTIASSNVTNFMPDISAGYNIGGHYNTSTSKFTAPVAGRYLFWMGLFRIGTVYDRWGFSVNGGGFGYPYTFAQAGPDGSADSGSAVISLAAGDYVTVGAQYGGSQIYGGHSAWGGYLLG